MGHKVTTSGTLAHYRNPCPPTYYGCLGRWSSLRGDAPAASGSTCHHCPQPLNSCVQPCSEGTGNAPHHANCQSVRPFPGKARWNSSSLSFTLPDTPQPTGLLLWHWVEELLRVGAPPQGCSLLPSILASELGTAPAGTRVAACPHRALSGFCLADAVAPWWSCLWHSSVVPFMHPFCASCCLNSMSCWHSMSCWQPQPVCPPCWQCSWSPALPRGSFYVCGAWPPLLLALQVLSADVSWGLLASVFHMEISQFGNPLGTTLECSAAEWVGTRASHLSNQGCVLRLWTPWHSRKYIFVNHSCQKQWD